MPEKYQWHFLEDLVNEHDFTSGVEVGVRWGQTSRYLMENCPDLHMWGVDLMQPLPNNTRNGQETYESWPWDQYRQHVKNIMVKWPERFKMLVMDTVIASKMFDPLSVDFVFIDCDHSYEGVVRDIRAWAPAVRDGGFITGHDINLDSVRRAVRDELGKLDTREGAWNNVWWVQKTISDSRSQTAS